MLAACGGGERDAEGTPSEVLPAVDVAPAPHLESESIFDEDGDLRASDERVAGLTLPMGLEENASDDERLHTYFSEAPIPALLRYFGPRLTTGTVDALAGGGAAYRAAIPREVTGGAVRLDVSIMPVPQHVLVEIRELMPEPATPPPESESLRALQEAIGSSE